MRAWEIGDSFGLEHLRLVTRPDPEPGPGQVVLEVEACSLNYRDLLMARGEYNPRQPLPLVPLSDGVGRVVAAGDGVDRVKVGDRVAATFAPRWIAGTPSLTEMRATRGGPLPGTLAEKLLLSQEECVAVPEHMSAAEAATLPCAALTAWTAMVELGDVKPGDTVLVLGSGGVSIFGLAIARMLGARVIATSSSDEKLERLRELGAFKTINYRATPEWGKAVRAASGGGVDHVLDVGGAATVAQSVRAVRTGGTVSLIGNLGGRTAELDVVGVFMSYVRLQGVFVGHRKGFESMCRALAEHELHPVIDHVFPFDEAPDAFAHLAEGDHFGKICIST